MKVQVYDPAMCCSSGTCGATVDPELVRFAADLAWLAGRGVTVERFNLAKQPAAFVEAPAVKEALTSGGNECLPLTLVDGAVAFQGRYPTRHELESLVGGTAAPGLFTDAVRELVAIGASIAANCEPCFKHHYKQALELGVAKQDMLSAVETAQMVKETPARAVLDLAQKFLGERSAGGGGGACDCGAPNGAKRPKCCG